MDTPLITVSLGVYNRENTVDRAIKSVLAQTYPHFELVIIDNGSTDRSGQIAEEYAARDARVRVVHLYPNHDAFQYGDCDRKRRISYIS